MIIVDLALCTGYKPIGLTVWGGPTPLLGGFPVNWGVSQETGEFPGSRVVFSRCASSCLYPGGLLGQGGLVRASPLIPRKPTGKLPSLAVPRAKCVPHASWLL